MKNSVFLAFCLMIFSALIMAHALFKEQLSPVKLLEARLERVEREKREFEFRSQLAAYQLADYQQQIATLIPSALRSPLSPERDYPLRQLASVVSGADSLAIERASSLMEKGKRAFRSQDYGKSNRLFEDLIGRYPESVYIIEAHLLLAEGQYQLKEFEASVATIDRMIDLFPESELTGFALLRLGGIFEVQDRLEDAGDIYRAVLANFNEAELQRQAKASLKGVQL